METLPKSFSGGAKYPLNIRFWAWLLGRPKGFFVILDFHEPVKPRGVQDFQASMEFHLWLAEIGDACVGTAKADFAERTFSFHDDSTGVSFSGKIDASVPRIEGVIDFGNLPMPYPGYQQHRITFDPTPED